MKLKISATSPGSLAERLRHYFLTYKLLAGETGDISIDQIYGRDHATKVVEASILDYQDEFGD